MTISGSDRTPVSPKGEGRGGRGPGGLPLFALGASILLVTAPPWIASEPRPGADGLVPSSEMGAALPQLPGDPDSADPLVRGAYLARAGNCVTCHTVEDGGADDFLAGGKPVETPFGTFYGTNITPDPETGIGGWSEDDFVRAMREGRAPDGRHLYPAFPYTAFTAMRDEDLSDLYAYLQSVPPIQRVNEDHDIPWFAGFRGGLAFWKLLNFDRWTFEPDPDRDEIWNRGAYLSRAVTHCVECHTPRTLTGGLNDNLRYAGTAEGADGDPVPNITPHETGIGDWSERLLVRYLQFGMDPDGDFAGGSMSQVIQHSTSYMNEDDLQAIARYILSLDPIENTVR